MSPDEVISQVKNFYGIELSRATLLRYENQGLIPKPGRGGGGAGGRWTDYPDGTIEEAYAAWCLLHGRYGTETIKKFFNGKMPDIPPSFIAKLREKQEECIANKTNIEEAWDDEPAGDGTYLTAYQLIYDWLYCQAAYKTRVEPAFQAAREEAGQMTKADRHKHRKEQGYESPK